MNKNRVLAIVPVAAVLLACHHDLPGQNRARDLGCHQITAAIAEMQGGLSFPPYLSAENPTKRGAEFDPNRYFETLTHLKIEDHFTLDYVYRHDDMSGYPLLYARPIDQAPYADAGEYAAAPERPDYLASVAPQDSPAGYFEYAVFAMSANQFYQYGHARYNDWRVLCGAGDVEHVIRSFAGDSSPGPPMTAAQKQQALAIPDPQPAVVLDDETATVRMLVFTKWGGFYRRTLTISRTDHSILDEQNEPLVEYDCGIAY